MPDYICKQKLLQEINSAENRKADNLMADWYYQMVNNQPKANVREEIQAHWELAHCDCGLFHVCSNCGTGFKSETKFCPNCGATMSEEAVEELHFKRKGE